MPPNLLKLRVRLDQRLRVHTQRSLIKANFVLLQRRSKTPKQTAAVLENEFTVAFNPPPPGALTAAEGSRNAQPSVPVA